jgi:hypothetical protein
MEINYMKPNLQINSEETMQKDALIHFFIFAFSSQFRDFIRISAIFIVTSCVTSR